MSRLGRQEPDRSPTVVVIGTAVRPVVDTVETVVATTASGPEDLEQPTARTNNTDEQSNAGRRFMTQVSPFGFRSESNPRLTCLSPQAEQ